MGMSYKPITFWSDEIVVGEVISASFAEDFNMEGKPLRELGERLNYSSLEKCIENGNYVLKMRPNTFIEFVEGS